MAEEPEYVAASAPAQDDAPPPVPNISDRLAELSKGPVYPSLHKDTYAARSPLQIEEFQRIEDNAKPEGTKELEHFESVILPFEQHLAPVFMRKNWLQRCIDDVRTRFSERPHRRFVALRTDRDVQQFFYQNSLGERQQKPFNPQFLVDREASRLAKLISYSAPAPVLRQAGLRNLSARQLAEHGLVMQDLRNYHRSPEDLAALFHNLTHLEAAGFSRFNFDSTLWTLADVASAYQQGQEEVANHFVLTVRDLIAAGVPAQDLPKFGARMEHIMQDSHPFEILLALKMDPVQLQQAFGFHPGHILNAETETSVLSSVHFDMLNTFANWNDQNLEQVGFTAKQMRQMKVVPELTTDSILRAVGRK